MLREYLDNGHPIMDWRYEKGEWLADVYILQSIPGTGDEWIIIADDVPQGRFVETPETCSLEDAKVIAKRDYQSRLLARSM